MGSNFKGHGFWPRPLYNGLPCTRAFGRPRDGYSDGLHRGPAPSISSWLFRWLFRWLAQSHQDLPKALVQGSPLYKGRGNSRVPIKKVRVPIFRVSCPYKKSSCPYLFGQIYVILCFNLGTKFASMICGSFLFHFQRRIMLHEAAASQHI